MGEQKYSRSIKDWDEKKCLSQSSSRDQGVRTLDLLKVAELKGVRPLFT